MPLSFSDLDNLPDNRYILPLLLRVDLSNLNRIAVRSLFPRNGVVPAVCGD